MALKVIILAAGQGKRMYSSLPKVLHPLAGKPMLQWVIEAAQVLNPENIYVVYGHAGEQILAFFQDAPVQWIRQTAQLGTGHAVAQVLPYLNPEDEVIILCGDVPLISSQTLALLTRQLTQQALNLVIAKFDNPTGLGRIIRDEHSQILGIVEEKDATEQQRTIREIYAGILATSAANLLRWLPKLSHANAQQEYYLTEIVDFAVNENRPINGIFAKRPEEIQGVNTRSQLIQLERYYQLQQAERLLSTGVTLLDPTRFDLRGELAVGQDVIIDVNVIIEGKVTIGNHCYIGPNTVLKNVQMADHVEILANCVIETTVIASHCTIGPFARLRPGSQLAQGAKIGNFVEIKQATIGPKSKVNHLSYIGDATLGEQVNIGAGTITCNYDGANKHHTEIGDHAFIGSNSQLVAPVKIGEWATIGAGSTITKDVPSGQLSLSRVKQQIIPDWQRPVKKGKE